MSEDLKDTILKIKAGVVPTLVAILTAILLQWMNEMRTDIKALLAQSNVDRTEISTMKVDIDMLKNRVYGTANNIPVPPPKQEDHTNMDYILPDNSKKTFLQIP